ncbi:MAG TPA: 2-oxoacid:acceptor oxidoreductase family protein [Chloroflexia bacterium]|nr:2-oxoacid:acceptor oxidoreductase family protein [Chloroflexia bacterium]
MYAAVIIAGPDEPGVFQAGQLLALAGQAEGRYVTWLPATDLEARAGLAHGTVIISQAPILSPAVGQPTAALVASTPALEHYALRVRAGGVLVVDSAVVEKLAGRSDIREIDLPATTIATDLGMPEAGIIALLGALIRATGVVRQDTIEQVLAAQLADQPRPVLAAYRQALRQGADLVAVLVFGYAPVDAWMGPVTV